MKRRYIAYVAFFVAGFIVGILYFYGLIILTNPHIHPGINTGVLNCGVKEYRRILKELGNDRYLVLRVVDFIEMGRNRALPRDKVVVILRHDVDFYPHKAYNMSREEFEAGIRSTYYIRVRGNYNILEKRFSEWLKWLNSNGFEVGLHYENLYYCDYNFTCAKESFLNDLKLLRSIVSVKTVCSHGNSVEQEYVNYELFKYYPELMKKAEIDGEAYLTVKEIISSLVEKELATGYIYLSDTKSCNKDWVSELKKATPGTIVYILIHPDNWNLGG